MDRSFQSITHHTLFACAVCASLLAACGRKATPENAAVEQDLIVCDDGKSSFTGEERYVLSAINRKLGYYSDLAAAIGAQSVSDCAGARAFMKGYQAFLAAHPGFDLDEPVPLVPPETPMPQAPPPTMQIAKVRGGVSPLFEYPNDPVVLMEWASTLHNGNCTGYFIAKNWIVTAAHCLPATDTLLDAADAAAFPGASHLYGHAKVRWHFTWADRNGAQVSAATVASTLDREGRSDVLQIPDMHYMGGDHNAFDFALLYLNPHNYDQMLPPDPSKGGAMRFSMTPAAIGDNLTFAGFSQPFITLDSSRWKLRSGLATVSSTDDWDFMVPVTFPPPPEDGDPTQPPPLGTQAALCQGDSGGPAYRFVNIGDPVNTVPIAFGTNQSVSLFTNSCARVGADEQWARNDIEVRFVEVNVRQWEGLCRELPLPGQTTPSFLQCWGKPCQEVGDCDQTNGPQICSQPGTSLLGTCSTCAAFGGGCSCVQGQCLPRPQPDAGIP